MLQEYNAPDAPDVGVEHVLSRVPYRDILENLFGGGSEVAVPDLPIISRACVKFFKNCGTDARLNRANRYEESYMRQPEPGEKACAMGEACECRFLDRQCPFTAVEFRLAGDPPSPQLCVLCSRKATQKMFYDMCYAGMS